VANSNSHSHHSNIDTVPPLANPDNAGEKFEASNCRGSDAEAVNDKVHQPPVRITSNRSGEQREHNSRSNSFTVRITTTSADENRKLSLKRRTSEGRNSMSMSKYESLVCWSKTSTGALRRQKLFRLHDVIAQKLTNQAELDEPAEEEEVKRRSRHSLQTQWDLVKTMRESAKMVASESVFAIFIFASAVVTGLSIDCEPEWAGWPWIDASFTMVFFVEMIMKLLWLRSGYFTHADRWWHFFEALLVGLGIVEAAIALGTFGVGKPVGSGSSLSFLRVLRLLRLSRLARVCRVKLFAELTIIISGAVGGSRTLVWVPCMVCIPIGLASMIFRETLGTSMDEGWGGDEFSSVPRSFYTLFRCTVASDCIDSQGRPLWQMIGIRYNWCYTLLYCCLDLLMKFGLFNVIIGIFIENVLSEARTNNLVLKRERLRDKDFFASKMIAVLSEILKVVNGNEAEDPRMDNSTILQAVNDLQITADIWEEVVCLPQVVDLFRDLAIADEDMADLFFTINADASGSINVAELFDGVAALRGAPRRSDVVRLNYQLEEVQEELWRQRDVNLTMRSLIERMNKPGWIDQNVRGVPLARHRLVLGDTVPDPVQRETSIV